MTQPNRSSEDLNRWGSTAKLQFFGLTFEDVAPIADELDFYEVEVVKTPTPPAATPLFGEEAVILLVLSPVAVSFLAELGKDTYKGLRRLVVALAKKAKKIRDNRGGNTLTFRIDRRPSYVGFTFQQPPDDETLAMALQQIPDVMKALPEDKHVLVCFDAEHGIWRWEAASPDVEAVLRS